MIAKDVVGMQSNGIDYNGTKIVKLCDVEWFDNEFNPERMTVGEARRLSVKVVEAAAEAMAAGKECAIECDKKKLREELADTIQACCNLAAAFGIFDLRNDIADCRMRNVERGKISKPVEADS